jgi:hypothetical protein
LEHDQRRSSEARATAEVVPSDPRGTFTSSRNGVTFREEEYRNGVRHGRLRWWDVVEEFLPETDVSDVAGSTASEAVRSSGREQGTGARERAGGDHCRTREPRRLFPARAGDDEYDALNCLNSGIVKQG